MNITAVLSEIWDSFSLTELSWMSSFPFIIYSYIQMFREKKFLHFYAFSIVPFVVCMIYVVYALVDVGKEKNLSTDIIIQGTLFSFVANINYISFVCFLYSILIFLFHLVKKEHIVKYGCLCIGSFVIWIVLMIFLVPHYGEIREITDIILFS